MEIPVRYSLVSDLTAPGLKVLSVSSLDTLATAAMSSLRKRQHLNLHQDFADACQRLFNAIDVASYIRPHRHKLANKVETLIAVRGVFAFLRFGDFGEIQQTVLFGSERYGGGKLDIGVEISPETWHSVIALEAGSVLFETKAGPYDPLATKEFPEWAPVEGDPAARAYAEGLFSHAMVARSQVLQVVET